MMPCVFCDCLLLVACCIVLTCCDFGLRVVWLLGVVFWCLFCWLVVCCLVSLGWFVQLRIACGGQALLVGGVVFLILDLCLVDDCFGAAFAGFVGRLFCLGG